MKTLNSIRKLYFLLLITLLVAVSACKEEEDPIPGAPPTVNAGPDLDGTVDNTVVLSGTASDPDGDALTISWSIVTRPDGSSASVSNASNLNASFVPDLPGNYTIQLSAHDGNFAPVTDEVLVNVVESVGEPPIPSIVAENGRPISEDNENNTVTVNTGFVLDGSNTSDLDTESSDLTFEWEITESPDGSESATITSNATDPDQAIFTPDAIGEYTVRLTVTDPDGNTASTEATIIANASPKIVQGTISADTVWRDIFDDPNMPDYLVVGNLSIAAELTVEPGVVVYVDEDVVLTVEENGGALISEGTAENGIVFTSSDIDGDIHWGGLLILSSSSKNSLSYTTVSYAGGYENLIYSSGWRNAGIAIDDTGKLKMSNTTISNNEGDGMFIMGSNSLTEFGSNAFANNASYAMSISINQAGVLDAATTFADNGDTDKRENIIRIYDSTLDEDQTWPTLNNSASYVLVGNVTLNADLTLNAGARLEFEEDIWMKVATGGALIANGTADSKVIFTSNSADEDQYWGGILIESSSANNIINHAIISYGGGYDNLIYYSGWRKANLAIADNGRIAITNTEISHGDGYGIFANSNGEISGFSNNNFHHIATYPMLMPINLVGMVDANTTITNNSHNVVAIFQSTLNDEASYNDPENPQWVTLAENAKYLFEGDATISDDLVLQEGAYLAFMEEIRMTIASTGSLKAVGTETNKITLTAYDQSGNDNWGGLLIQSDDDNELRYAEVSYAGKYTNLVYISGWKAANIAVADNASLDIYDTTVSDSDDYGLVVHPTGEVNGLTNSDPDPETTVKNDNSFSGNSNADEIVFF